MSNQKKLFLKPDQLVAGVTVAICLDGKDEPEKDEKGELLCKVLYGGVPVRLKIYPIGTMTEYENRYSKGEIGMLETGSFEPDSVNENVRFMPTEIFMVGDGDIPSETEFAVFVEGECLVHDDRKNNVYILSDSNGNLLSNNGYVYEHFGKPFPLPPNAMLVPITKHGKGS